MGITNPKHLGKGWLGVFPEMFRQTGPGDQRRGDASAPEVITASECYFLGLGTGLGSALLLNLLFARARQSPRISIVGS